MAWMKTTLKEAVAPDQGALAAAKRLRQAREFLGLTQTEFAAQISISRVRLASYEDGRAPLRCDIALRACRQFFISEFWLACGAVNEVSLKAKNFSAFSDLDARLTMGLAAHPADFSLSPDVSFLDGFNGALLRSYLWLAKEQRGFPRINPLPSDNPEYFTNALVCLIGFWRRGLPADKWVAFFCHIAINAHSTFRHGQHGFPSFQVIEARQPVDIIMVAERRAAAEGGTKAGAKKP
jgi:transcriptional regulator with XRE-family HTH domain